jgi:sterol desaturase/sphingolipid hydroxylase (fatty acid hydroxylase superfamily)
MRLFRLEHSDWAYRADFTIYTLASLVMALYLALASPATLKLPILGLAALGLISWPLAEYGLHRFVLHGIRPFCTWHAAHHQRPHALICTPTILSGTLIATLVFVPVILISNRWLATALTFGLLTGYLFYAVVHHALHHWRTDNAWLLQRKRWHALHHDPRQAPGCYGVTGSLWDKLLRTHG